MSGGSGMFDGSSAKTTPSLLTPAQAQDVTNFKLGVGLGIGVLMIIVGVVFLLSIFRGRHAVGANRGYSATSGATSAAPKCSADTEMTTMVGGTAMVDPAPQAARRGDGVEGMLAAVRGPKSAHVPITHHVLNVVPVAYMGRKGGSS